MIIVIILYVLGLGFMIGWAAKSAITCDVELDNPNNSLFRTVVNIIFSPVTAIICTLILFLKDLKNDK